MTTEPTAARRARLALLALALLLAAGTRLAVWEQVFVDGRVILDGTDGYYHLRRAYLAALDWPRLIQVDHLMSVPEGARVQWPPLFDLGLATLAKLAPGEPAAAIERLGAGLPVALGVLQVLALAWLLRRLAGPWAAVWGALGAALLPGVVRYGLLGALDHDPLIELAALLVLGGMAGALRGSDQGGSALLRHAAEISVGLAALMLTWAGAVIHVGLFSAVALVVAAVSRREPGDRRRLGAALAIGGTGAALTLLPFVATSVWTRTDGATFAGLSWLQQAALLGLVVLGGALAWPPKAGADGGRWSAALGLLAAVGLAVLLPRVTGALAAGVAFLGRGEPFLRAVAESRPLLALFGVWDPWPLLVRLSALPLAYPLLLPWLGRRGRRSTAGFLAAWALYTLAVALVQARYSHAAALAAAAVLGVALSRTLEPALGGRRRRAAAAIGLLVVLLPAAAAYLALPGLGAYRMLGRVPPLAGSGYLEVCGYLESAAAPSEAWLQPGRPAAASVLAPWEAGHWIHWLGRQATVANPFGPQGQPGYRDGVGFFFLEDEARVLELLERRRVRWVVVDTDLVKLGQAARLAGLAPARFVGETDDGQPFVEVAALMRTIGGRLAFAPAGVRWPSVPLGPDRRLTEVFRSTGSRHGPGGRVPNLRVYELRAGPPG